jgi:hypothetical protein
MSFLHFDFCMLHYKIRSPWPLLKNPKPDSKTSSRPRLPFATSMAIGECSPTAATTSTISRQSATFEEVCFLLWHRRLPTRAELGDLQSQLAASRQLKEPIIRLMRSLPPVDGMDALRTVTSALAHYESDVEERHPAAQYRKAVRLTAQLGSIVATWGRLQAGGGPIAPDPAMGHAANFLYMLTGERPNSTAIRRLRHRAHAPRRPRAQCLDVCRARGGCHAHRHLLRDGGGHRDAQRAACMVVPTPKS